jgi:Family of unknown function (DUF6200)
MEKAQPQTPVIVDLGTRKRKAIKDLKRGKGSLMDEVEDAVTHARSALPDGDQNKPVIPVVILYRKKRKKRGGGGAFPFSPLNPLSMLRC